MKIRCHVCEAAEAKVFCCADEAALCSECDRKVHAANKLAGNHRRVLLSTSSSPKPKCDVCQETVGYFFCLEDRALLCRRCDVNIHSMNSYVSGHKRFLLTGVRVGLEATEQDGSSTRKLDKLEKLVSPHSTLRKALVVPSTGQPEAISGHVNVVENHLTMKKPLSAETTPHSIPECNFSEFFGFTDSNHNFESRNDASKDDGGRVGHSLWSQILQSVGEEVFDDECLNHEPGNLRRVPQSLSQ